MTFLALVRWLLPPLLSADVAMSAVTAPSVVAEVPAHGSAPQTGSSVTQSGDGSRTHTQSHSYQQDTNFTKAEK